MNLLAALRALEADGTISFRWRGKLYRLVLRHGLIRMVIEEDPDPRILERSEARELLEKVAAHAKQIEAHQDYWVLDVDPTKDLLADPSEVIKS